MIRIGFTGVPGAGKTSTARAFSAECRRIDGMKNVELTSEYARRFISKYGIPNTQDQFRILAKQIEWENSVSKADIVITDSPVFLGFLYATMAKQTMKDVMYLNDIYKAMNRLNFPEPRYDIVFHIPPLLKPVDDGIRAQEQFSDEWRNKADADILFIFNFLFKPKELNLIMPTDLKERVDFCVEKTENYITLKNRAESHAKFD